MEYTKKKGEKQDWKKKGSGGKMGTLTTPT